jgi:hypothetical protein
MDSREVEFYGEIKHETDDAILVNDGVNEIWLPKSQIEIDYVNETDAQITLPEWLAIDKGII